MLRRALLAVTIAALATCGAASAVLLARPSGPAVGTTTSTGPTTATTATTVATTVASTSSSVLVVTGHGWGHGLGMSQWGAYGYAKHGWTYDQILAHYYSGTTLGPSPVTSVRVLLADGAKKVTLSSALPWKITDEAGKKWPVAPGSVTLTPALAIVPAKAKVPIPLGSQATVPGSVLVDKKAYRGGLRISSLAGRLRVVNVVGLEAYLKGVVPSEMPSSWSPEALKAQAVAARSYAVATLSKGDFDLYADTRSQVYGGIAAESPPASAAVDATQGRVVLYDGKVATTYFFSTSGGRTVSAEEATGRAVPYLRSVADPYDDASPYHNWGPVLVDGATVTKALKLRAPLDDVRTTIGPSGRVAKLTALDSNGGQTTVTGSAARTALGLRSTWFTVGLLSLTKPVAPVVYGGALTLTGTARGVGAVALESRPATGGAWTAGSPLAAAASGTFATTVRPQVTTQYRLVAGSVHAAQVTVPVTPLVKATGTAARVDGTIRPALAGAAVTLQRQDALAWNGIASGVTDASGAFAIVGTLTPGTYRVRCAPGHGLVAGASATFTVA